MNGQPSSTPADFQQHYSRWIVDDIRPNLAITFGAGLDIRPDIFAERTDQFLKTLMRDTFGRRWSDEPASHWPVVIGFPEHISSNLHLQSAARAAGPICDALLEAELLWKKFRTGGHYYCCLIDDLNDYASYMCKEVHKPEVRDAMLLFKRLRAD